MLCLVVTALRIILLATASLAKRHSPRMDDPSLLEDGVARPTRGRNTAENVMENGSRELVTNRWPCVLLRDTFRTYPGAKKVCSSTAFFSATPKPPLLCNACLYLPLWFHARHHVVTNGLWKLLPSHASSCFHP